MTHNLFRSSGTDLFRPNSSNAIFTNQPQQSTSYQTGSYYGQSSNTWQPMNTAQPTANSKLGSNRATTYDSNKLNTLATMPPPNKSWTDKNIPATISVADGTGNLSLLELRIEDYYLMKTNSLTDLQRKAFKDATDKRQVNQQYFRNPLNWQPTTINYEPKTQSTMYSVRGSAYGSNTTYNPYSQTNNTSYNSTYNQPVNPFNTQQNNPFNQPTNQPSNQPINPFTQSSSTPVNNPFASNTLMNNNTPNQASIWRNSQATQPNQNTQAPPNIFTNNSSVRMTSSTTPNLFVNTSTNNSNNLFTNNSSQQQPVNIFANSSSSQTPNYFAQNTPNNNIFQQPQNNSSNLFANSPAPANIFTNNQGQQQHNIFSSQVQQPAVDQPQNSFSYSLFANSQPVQQSYDMPIKKKVFSSTSMEMQRPPVPMSGCIMPFNQYGSAPAEQAIMANHLQNILSALVRGSMLGSAYGGLSGSTYGSIYGNPPVSAIEPSHVSPQSSYNEIYNSAGSGLGGIDQMNPGPTCREVDRKDYLRFQDNYLQKPRKLVIVREEQRHKENPLSISHKHKKPEFISLYGSSELQKSMRIVKRESLFGNQKCQELQPIKYNNSTTVYVMDGQRGLTTLSLEMHDVNFVEVISNELIRRGFIRRNQSVQITSLHLEPYPKITCQVKKRKLNLPEGYRSVPENPDSDTIFNLQISNQHGRIRWLAPVNVSGIDFSDVVLIGPSEVQIYNSQSCKPPPGKGLNVPCEITMYNCDIIQKLKKSSDEKDKITKKLRSLCDKQGVEFVSYNGSDGSWTFRMQELP